GPLQHTPEQKGCHPENAPTEYIRNETIRCGALFRISKYNVSIQHRCATGAPPSVSKQQPMNGMPFRRSHLEMLNQVQHDRPYVMAVERGILPALIVHISVPSVSEQKPTNVVLFGRIASGDAESSS